MKKFIVIGTNRQLYNDLYTVSVNYFKEIKCIGMFDNLVEAMETILEKQVDFIFLDTEDKCLEIANFLLDITNFCLSTPYIIGYSSFKEDAYLAFQYNFEDFLLINYNKLCIHKCFHKYLSCISEGAHQMVCIKSNKDYQYIPIHAILFLKADNNTTDFYLKDGTKISAYKTLKTFENSLADSFYRIHKSYIINSTYLERIHYGRKVCELCGNRIKVPFSQTFLKNIEIIQSNLHRLALTF